jgi:creatinine amidohydrolase
MKLDELRWPQLAGEIERGTPLILPFGSIEQHGPHLPFDTDTICVQGVADLAAERSSSISLPALSYGAPSRPRSGGGPMFPLGAEIPLGVYYEVVRGMIRNLLERGTRNLVLLTWHTENAPVLYDAARVAASDAAAHDARIVVMDEPGNLIKAETVAGLFPGPPVPGKFEHAGHLETSVMMALQPDSVLGHTGIETALPSLQYDVIPQPPGSVSATGSFTSSDLATAEIGQLLLDDVVPGLADVISDQFGDRRSS